MTVEGIAGSQKNVLTFPDLDISAAASGGDTVTVPPLGYKKWGLVDQGTVVDCTAPGLSPPCVYDHMAYTSLAKGFSHSVSTGKLEKLR